MNPKHTPIIVMMIMTGLLLTGCSTSSGSSPTVSSISQTTTTQTEQLIDQNEDGSVQVIQLTSSSVQYDGEHGVGRSGHHSPDYLTVTVSLDENGVITDVSNQHQYGHPKSRQYQSAFENAIAGYAIGKTLDQAQGSRIGGASTTTQAWNVAISELQTQQRNG